MSFIHLSALFGALLLYICFLGIYKLKGSLPKYAVFALLAAAVAVRLVAAALSKGFGTDTACFASWADRIFTLGPAGFYSPDVFTDYPPGYMYVLWAVGALRSLFSIESYSAAHLILLRLPAILCDAACGLLLWRECSKNASERQALFVCAAYLFHPAIILNSSVWGQVDAVFTLALLLMCLYLIRGRLLPAYIAFGAGILIKPQTLMFAPVLLAGIIDWVFLKEFSAKKFFANLFQGLAVIAGMVALCLPFGFSNVWKQYTSTVGSYPYAAVNACNFWGMFGLNWVSQDSTFPPLWRFGIPCRLIGGAAIVAAVVFVLLLGRLNKKDTHKYPFLAAFLILTIYVFSVRMHERYMFPGLLLLLFAFVYKPSKLTFLCYSGFSLMHFYNTADVLFFYDPYNYDRKAPAILLVSAGMLVCLVLLYFVTWRLYRGEKSPQADWSSVSAPAPAPFLDKLLTPGRDFTPLPSKERTPLKRADFIILLIITLVYSCFALYDLGERSAPSTHYDMIGRQSIELNFGEKIPASFSYYIAPWHGRTFSLEGRRNASDEWADLGSVTLSNVFTWQNIELNGGVPFLRLTLDENQASILELVFLDAYGYAILPENASQYPELFDEQALYPEAISFRNSMYFDEIYHGRTAYEFINGLTSYENTHPPLGKIFIAFGVLIFGMNPFGWRIVGTLFGIAMVPFAYLFAKKLTDSTPAAALACTLFTFDFMHFAQTRLATIDVYITFFVILMYYFMYLYSTVSFYDTPLKKTFLPLGACGVCMGLGIACKWTGIYAGAGLALIFFGVLFRRYREYVYAKKHSDKDFKSLGANAVSRNAILEGFAPNTLRTIGFCLIFFVAVPAVIYALSYLPFVDYTEGRGLFSRMLHNQETMFNYHSKLIATHDYSSPWYDWPIIRRPIWYYSKIVTGVYQQGGLREGISAFGNPAVWWTGIPASLYMVYLAVSKKDKKALFLLIGYMAQYLPWFFVTRITFIYHYFPSVIFVVMMIVYGLKQLTQKLPRKYFILLSALYAAVTLVLFFMFYPVLSGQPVEAAYVDKYLRWFSGWVLTSR